MFVHILNDVLLPYSEDRTPLKWTFQQDSAHNHTLGLAKQWFIAQNIDVLPWPAQSPDWNPSETLSNDIEKVFKDIRPTNIVQLTTVIEKAWAAIPLARCQRLIDSMTRRCAAVIKNFGYATYN